jgi:hypothetical protein
MLLQEKKDGSTQSTSMLIGLDYENLKTNDSSFIQHIQESAAVKDRMFMKAISSYDPPVVDEQSQQSSVKPSSSANDSTTQEYNHFGPNKDPDQYHPPRFCARHRRYVRKRRLGATGIKPPSLSIKALPREADFKSYEAEETRLNIESKSSRGQDETSQSSTQPSPPPPNEAKKLEVESHPCTATSSVCMPNPVFRSDMTRGA